MKYQITHKDNTVTLIAKSTPLKTETFSNALRAAAFAGMLTSGNNLITILYAWDEAINTLRS